MRKIVLACAAILVATCSYAQNFNWGVKAALNLTSEYDMKDRREQPHMTTGFSAGFAAEFKLSERLGLQPELLYSTAGAKYYINDKASQGYYNLNYSYLDLPVMVKVYFLKRKLSLDLGPKFSYMLTANEKKEPRNKTVNKIDIIDQVDNRLDIAASIGASFKFGKSFDVTARYNMGFLKTLKDNTSEIPTVIRNNKNYSIQLGLGARFGKVK